MDVSREMETIRGKLANRHGYGALGIPQLCDLVADLTRAIDALNKQIEELKGEQHGNNRRTSKTAGK